ncbi:AAA family ATPase [Isoalcanivorax beigongshangi]|uniref:CpaE family protein n=1 Tax=Isoalcanivorax beigongshangi TaxID=3238810 RepID=A0ABV4AER9_9GAMM
MVDENMLAVIDDAGTEAWLDAALQGTARYEKVSSQDLGRVIRLLEATGAKVALVELSDRSASQALAVITALSNARPWVTIVALCRVSDQELTLACMRAGARDCVVVGADGQELRDRLRQHQLLRSSAWRDQMESRLRNLTLVASVGARMDTQFFAQNLAVAMAAQNASAKVLAVDVYSTGDQVFHLETHNSFDLSQLLTSPDTLDENLIQTALDEYRPGLRVLAGGGDQEFLGDRGADLFIALTRLMSMFDRIVLNVGNVRQADWIQSIGVHVAELIVVANQEVGQLRAVREEVANWRAFLPSQCQILVALDGYEASLPPSVSEVAENVGAGVAATLPLEWKGRLEAINMGVPFAETMPRSGYNKAMNQLAQRLLGQGHNLEKKKRALFG